jgi:hypothetical protein
MSSRQRDRSPASNPFGPRNVRLVETAAASNDLSPRQDDGDLHLRFVDDVDGLVILAVDRPLPSAQQVPLSATAQAGAPAPSRLRFQVQRFLSFWL